LNAAESENFIPRQGHVHWGRVGRVPGHGKRTEERLARSTRLEDRHVAAAGVHLGTGRLAQVRLSPALVAMNMSQ
jgi:hypothetical protein